MERDISRLRDKYNAIFGEQPSGEKHSQYCCECQKKQYKELIGLLQYVTRFGPHDVRPTLSDLQNHVDRRMMRHFPQLMNITRYVIAYHQAARNEWQPDG